MLPWSSKGITDEVLRAWSQPTEKSEKKAASLPYGGDETAALWRGRIQVVFLSGNPKAAFPIWERRPQDVTGTFTWRLCQSTWLFLFRQYTENICFFSKFSAGGLCDWGILLVISLEFQGNKASTVFYDTAYLKRKNAEWRGRFPRKAPSFLTAL